MYTQYKKTKSVSQAVAGLRNEGYQFHFRREATCIYCFELQERVMPEDFNVDEYFHYEEPGNPDADRIVYAISFSKGGRGFLIDVCNVYTDNISYEMEQKLQWQYPVLA